jgi:hypothetical protein
MTWVSASSQYTVGTAVNLFHLLGFLLEVSARTLYNANRVNPKIRAANFPSHLDRVSESVRKMVNLDASDMLLEVRCDSAKLLTRAPLVR